MTKKLYDAAATLDLSFTEGDGVMLFWACVCKRDQAIEILKNAREGKYGSCLEGILDAHIAMVRRYQAMIERLDAVVCWEETHDLDFDSHDPVIWYAEGNGWKKVKDLFRDK